MGCANSKLDNLPAVALCRDRCKFLDQALLFSHALVDAHLAYAESLKTLGSALHRLFDQDVVAISTGSGSTDGDSIFTETEDSKSSPSPPLSSFHHSPSSSNLDSKLPSPSDSEDEDSDNAGFESLEHDSCINQDKTRSGNFMFSNYDSAREQSTPPPPSTSSWDFLNIFNTYERYEPVFSSNWAREEGAEKVRIRAVTKKNRNRSVVAGKDDLAKCDSRAAGKINEAKKLDQSEKKNDSKTSGSTYKKLSVSDVMVEIEDSFEKASESASKISKLISQGQRFDFSKDARASSRGLSSTLKKLCIWEQKLYLEVKAEERLRMILEKKCRQLKNMVENKKTEARKVDSVRTLIRTLSIKLKVSIQVVDRISITVSNLRDEEFLAEITELIHGSLCMWKTMLDCHKHQSQILTEAKSFNAAFNGKLDDVHLEAAVDLKNELQNWKSSFSNWIIIQKDCIKALNGWLLRCLLHEPEPEETPNDDWRLPFSPARIGAPPVFVLCNRWAETMEKISDKEASETIHGLISCVDQVLEQHNLDLQRMVMANEDIEKKIKKSNFVEQKMMKNKKVNHQTLNGKDKAAVPVAAEDLHKTSTLTMSSDVQFGLKRIFSVLMKFSADSIKVYEELCAIMEENSQMREKQSGP